MVGYIFGGSTGETPESLKRKRDIADALVGRILGQHSAPRTVGEAVSQGLSGIGQALIARRVEKRADKAASLGRSSANAAISSLAENLGGSPSDFPAAPGSSGAASAATPAAPTDMPSERVASAFAASEPDSGTGGRVTTAASRAGVSSETARKNPMELASSLLGKGEVPDRATIQEYMKNGGVNLDPATTAWCAAFVNASLGQAGIKGTGSNMARSFLKWGQGVDTPAAGDIGVLPRGDPNGPYGHVGFVEGYDPKTGMVTLLAGNQGNAVSEKQFPADSFLGFRRGPAGAPAVAATNAMAGNSPAVAPLPAPVNVPDTPVAGQPQPVQVAQAANTGTPGQMSDAQALKLLGASPVHPGQGNSIADLLRTASNPWLNKNASAVVNALLANKLKQQDPGNQLDMRYKQAQLDQLLNPTKAPTVQQFYDPQTGQPYEAQWNPKTKAWDKVGGNKASSNGITVSPDGTVQIGGPSKPLTEGQSKDVVFFTRGAGALPNLDKYGGALTSLPEKTAGGAPIVGNYLKSKEYQQAEQAGLEFLQAILRKDTGAAITPAETAEYGKVYLPQPGDSPEVLAQKKAARHRALAAIKLGLPSTAILNMEKAGVDFGQGALPEAPPQEKTTDLSKMPAPEGVDPNVWAHVPPEKRKLWLQ